MNYILNIDTATEEAHVSIAGDGIVLGAATNRSAKDHASFLQPAIQQLTEQTKISLNQLNAIAVTAGPGSYTGLRVGMASAKGLCYALNKPLITLSTLQVLAASVIMEKDKHGLKKESLLCPMIDARRMEVFTAVYDIELNVIAAPCALILDERSFEQFNKNEMIFFGTGAEKWRLNCRHPHAQFINASILSESISRLSYDFYKLEVFAQIAESQPMYLKEFHDVRKV